MWYTVVLTVVLICLAVYTQQEDPCVLVYGCKCVRQMKKIVCSDLDLSEIPDPYRLSAYMYDALDLSGNKIRDLDSQDMQKWPKFEHMDLRRNPLSRATCDMLNEFVTYSRKTVISDCRCVYCRAFFF